MLYLFAAGHAGKDKKAAKDVEHPIKERNEGDSQADHDAPHQKSAKDAPKQQTVLVLGRNGEVSKDESNDKDIVHRKGEFDEIAGEKLPGFLVSAHVFNGEHESQREGKPNPRPNQRFPKLNDVGLAMKDAQIQRQKNQD